MWCEAWVGRWIPLDASADEVGGSPALVKLIHSDKLLGTQGVRWAMTKSLEVTVLDVEAAPTAKSGLKTGIAGHVYTNADFAFRWTVPDGWKLEDKSTPAAVTLKLNPPEGLSEGRPLIHLVAFGLPSNLDPQVIVGARKSRFAAMYNDFKVLTDEKFSLGSAPAQRLVFRHQLAGSPDKTIKTTELVWIDGRSGYLLNLIAAQEVHDALLAKFEALLVGFESARGPEPTSTDAEKAE